jgi:uncharacterized protein
MIAIDTNILIYSHRNDFPQHTAAKRAIDDLHMRQVNWAIPVVCIHEFLSIVTGFKGLYEPTPMVMAISQMRTWLESPKASILYPTSLHLDTLEQVVLQGQARGGQVHDARVAAICLENGVRELWTADRDFARFGMLPTRNPLL